MQAGVPQARPSGISRCVHARGMYLACRCPDDGATREGCGHPSQGWTHARIAPRDTRVAWKPPSNIPRSRQLLPAVLRRVTDVRPCVYMPPGLPTLGTCTGVPTMGDEGRVRPGSPRRDEAGIALGTHTTGRVSLARAHARESTVLRYSLCRVSWPLSPSSPG